MEPQELLTKKRIEKLADAYAGGELTKGIVPKDGKYDVRRILHGFYTNPNDFSKRPLSKFRMDLAKQLGWM